MNSNYNLIAMGNIIDTVSIEGRKGVQKVRALFDTGSDVGRITPELAEELGLALITKGAEMNLPDKKETKTDIVGGMLVIKGCRFPAFFAILKVRENDAPAGIGHLTMQAMGIELDSQKESYTVRCNLPTL